MCAKEEKKKPKMKTYEDKGTKVDFFNYGDGREAFFFKTEEFRGLSIGAVKLGWTNKYGIFTPQKITQGTLDVMSANASIVSGSTITSNDFIVFSDEKEPTVKKAKEEKK